jgi:hypothetical protein
MCDFLFDYYIPYRCLYIQYDIRFDIQLATMNALKVIEGVIRIASTKRHFFMVGVDELGR